MKKLLRNIVRCQFFLLISLSFSCVETNSDQFNAKIDNYKKYIIQDMQLMMNEFKKENYQFVNKHIEKSDAMAGPYKQRAKQFLSYVRTYHGKISEYKIMTDTVTKMWSLDLKLKGLMMYCFVECKLATIELIFTYTIIEDKLYLSSIEEGERSKLKDVKQISDLGVPFLQKFIEGDMEWLEKQSYWKGNPRLKNKEILSDRLIKKMKQIREKGIKYEINQFVLFRKDNEWYEKPSDLPCLGLIYEYNSPKGEGVFKIYITLVKTKEKKYYLLSMDFYDKK